MLLRASSIDNHRQLTSNLIINMYPIETVPNTLIQEFPIQDNRRKCTDIVCTILTLLIFLSLLGFSIINIHRDSLYKMSFPSDGDGSICGIDYPAYKYLYISNLNDMSKRVCVTHCPTRFSVMLDCMPTFQKGCFVRRNVLDLELMDSQPVESPLGKYCLPRNTRLREKLTQNAKISELRGFMNNTEKILRGCGLAIAIGLFFTLVVQACPQFMNYASVVLGILASGVLAWVIYYKSYHHFRYYWVIAIILAIISLLLLLNLIVNSLRTNGIFLNHASRFISQNPILAIAILSMYALIIALFALTAFELFAVWTHKGTKFEKHKIFHEPIRSKWSEPLTLLILIQLYFGLNFLKQLFNFIVSGNAIHWYFHYQPKCCQPFWRAIMFHFGSIMLCSVMVGILWLSQIFFDLMRPSSKVGAYAQMFNCACGWLTSLFSLARGDTMAVINLSGVNYYQAARISQELYEHSRICYDSRSISRFYRLGAHAFLLCSLWLISIQNNNLLFDLLVVLMGYFLLTYFIDLHADAAEALTVTFLMEESMSHQRGLEAIQRAPGGLVADVMASSKYRGF